MSRSFLQKARTCQSTLVFNYRLKRTLKRRAYRCFLQQNTGYLPSLKVLEDGRMWAAITSFLSLTPMCLGTVINASWVESDLVFLPLPIQGLFSPAILCGACFLILASFSAMFDYVLFKRGSKNCLIHW
jgi:hypothetical protein